MNTHVSRHRRLPIGADVRRHVEGQPRIGPAVIARRDRDVHVAIRLEHARPSMTLDRWMRPIGRSANACWAKI